VAVLLGTLVMAVLAVALLVGRHQLGRVFSEDQHVVFLTSQAVVPLAASLIGEGANTVIAGVLRGCGRQKIGAAINLFVYWGVGLPVSAVLAFWVKLGSLGLWTGLACTASAQALILSLCVFGFDWDAEAQRAKALVVAGELLLEEDEQGDIADTGGEL
jgi:MATE family multidrug resistance protein